MSLFKRKGEVIEERNTTLSEKYQYIKNKVAQIKARREEVLATRKEKQINYLKADNELKQYQLRNATLNQRIAKANAPKNSGLMGPAHLDNIDFFGGSKRSSKKKNNDFFGGGFF
jgi:chromosome segregation ATPase